MQPNMYNKARTYREGSIAYIITSGENKKPMDADAPAVCAKHRDILNRKLKRAT